MAVFWVTAFILRTLFLLFQRLGQIRAVRLICPLYRDFANMSSQQEALQRAFDAKTAYFVNNIAELSLETQASTNAIVHNYKF
jgi:hypothetical protein